MRSTNDEKFDNVYCQYKNLIMKVATDKLHDYHTAQEICQQTFLEYYLHIDNVEERLIKPWLILVAKNAAIDYFRKASNKYEYKSDNIELESNSMYEIISDYGVERIVDKIVQKDFIFKIMEELKEVNKNWYEVILSISILNKSQEETAKDLGISLSILRARLYRAREWIRKNYGEEYKKL
jgi:RNA polymerase sigma factor (sigma-70 family)